MGGLFGGGKAAPVAAPQPLELPTPKVQRMPTETDPSVLAAAQRTRSAAMRRTGRLSTILTDNTESVVGSSGQKLGA